jgi:hypothetical protein
MDERAYTRWLTITAGCLGLVTTVTWAVQLLPTEVSAVLSAWVLASLPIGVLIGYCALGED